MTLETTSKFIAYVLRHAPESIGIRLDPQGWVGLDVLVAGAVASGHRLDCIDVVHAVKSGLKQRFELSTDGARIRALQGHSTPQVQRSFEALMPPGQLFHGTATRFLEAILRQGLRPGARQHVHLSADVQTATQVGQRHGKAHVLRVDAQRMHALGHAFHRAENGVWLTGAVPPEFLSDADKDWPKLPLSPWPL